MNYLNLYELFFTSLLEGDRKKCSEIISDSLENNYDIKRIYIEVFQKSLVKVGLLWQENKIMEGFDVTYLGTNVPDVDIINVVKKINPDIIGISCTMDFHISRVKSLIEKIDRNNISSKICVGGFAFNNNPSLVDYVGADFTGITAMDTINYANQAFGVLDYAK